MPEPSGIITRFDERKTAAAAGVLLEEAGGRMGYFLLIKMLYIADRASWLAFGRPITGDKYVSMKDGPVLSNTLDLIKNEFPLRTESPWAQNIQRVGRYEIKTKTEETELGPLSEAEIEILREVYKVCIKFDQWKLRDMTHSLPEWTDPGDSSLPITPEDILRALQKPPEEIEQARLDALEVARFEAVFGA